jgi:biotin synthase
MSSSTSATAGSVPPEHFDVSAARAALLGERRRLTTAEIAALAALPQSTTPALAQLAHEVRLEWCGDIVEVEGILSVKTGGCPEDCQFCSQSASFDTDVKATPFLDTAEVLEAARETEALGATEFCLVLAIRGPDDKTMDRLIELTEAIQTETSLNVAISAGILDEAQAQRLADAGVHRYNHNLETARSFFPEIVSTHSWEERKDTCDLVRAHGMELCCGVLLGMGESDEQRVELLGQLMDLGPAEVPINFLNPRPGTPLQVRRVTPAAEAIRWIALFRLGLPDVLLRYAGGREITLGDMQELGMTSGINALIIGNYLTTLGRDPSEDLDMLKRLEMPIAAVAAAI